METTLPSACTGSYVTPTADGPDVTACTRRGCSCKARTQVKARIARTADVFLGAATATDEEAW